MKMLIHVFLTHRQIGQCEAYYRLFPSLHLSKSTVGTVYIHLGFHKSKFLKKVEKTEENASSLIEIENKEGYYVETSSINDKFLKRPDCLKHITLVQWCKRYTPYGNKNDLQDSDRDEEVDSLPNIPIKGNESNSIEEDFIISLDPSKRLALPTFVELQGSFYKGEPRMMKLRKPCAVRYHKFKRENQPHEFYFSELELYHDFQTNQEREKCQEEFDFCLKIYLDNQDQINYVRSKAMPYLQATEDALELAEEIVNQDNIEELLDAENAQENAECQDEGSTLSGEFIAHDLDQLPQDNPIASEALFKVVEPEESEVLNELTRQLDDEQLAVVVTVINFCKLFKRALPSKEMNSFLEPAPKPIYMKVIGSAGTGKSHVINVVSQWVEKILRMEGDQIHQPYCIKTAHTGKKVMKN